MLKESGVYRNQTPTVSPSDNHSRDTLFLWLLIISACILLLRLVYVYIADPLRFPMRTIKISGHFEHITPVEIKDVLRPYTQFSFFTFPSQKIYSTLSTLPWAGKVEIERIWPDTLRIVFLEKKAVAYWNNSLLSSEGEVFYRENPPPKMDLPYLSGSANQASKVLQVYQKMSKILLYHGLQVRTLQLRENRAWEVKLSNGMLLRLDKKDWAECMQRFCRVYPRVFADRADQVVSVDLRYPRGMAVKWKPKRDDNG
ncbi:MAG: cell division protein FtsQ/DivIB [Legionellaceae bacterium]|nr:cell division protein FtsQ/DivIB [Legionellaceae bacterium]